MSIEMMTTDQQLDKFFEIAEKEARKQVINYLAYLGEECVSMVREGKQAGLWIDRTGNLRSSIGYVVVVDGEIEQLGGFTTTENGTELGASGTAEGRTYVEQLAQQNNKGFSLILVAGMAYASYVEAMENKDVLANAELYARQEAPKLAEKLEEEITKIYDIL